MDKRYIMVVVLVGVALLIMVVGGVGLIGKEGKKTAGGGGLGGQQQAGSGGGYGVELKGCGEMEKGGKELEVWMEVGQDKISALEMVVGTSGGVKVSGVKENKTYFTVMKNKEEEGKWRYTAIVMKRSEELPTGRFLVGTIGYSGGGKAGGMEIGGVEVVKAIVGGQQPEKIKLEGRGCGTLAK